MALSSAAPALVEVPAGPPAEARPGRARLITAAVYLGAAALTVLLTILVLELWRADLRAPLEHGSDVPSYHLVVKAVMEHPWYLTNPLLGMPGTLETHEFPFVIGDGIHLLLVKVLGLFTRSSALAMNLYFLLGFPLTTITTMLALRRLGCSRPSAIAAGVLFAFLPLHTQRQEVHVFMATYWAVPLLVLVLVWLGEQRPLLPWIDRRRALASLAICALVSGTGMYQAFFGGVLLAVATALAALRHRSLRHALAGLALLGTLAAGLGVQALPVVLHRAHHGDNPAVAHRSIRESEMYGLKPGYLLLPIKNHRLERLNRLTAPAYEKVPLEGSTMSLGALGAAGFLGLLGALLLRDRARPSPVRDRLAEASLTATLFASAGGFSFLFALLVTPQFRGHNRISIYIGCIALFAVALALDRVRRRWGPRWHLVAAGVALSLGVWDQTSAANIRNYDASAAEYRSDAALVKQIEQTVPPGAMIFLVPYRHFPEGGYEELRPYFHSASLRWSFPTMKGRPTAKWQQDMAARPSPQLVAGLLEAKFDGILIHRPLLPWWGRIETELGQLLHQTPLVSPDRQFSFFDLSRRRAGK